MSSENPLVLIVDDDQLTRSALRDGLKQIDIDAAEAKDGKEGLEKATQLKPTLIVLDENLPDMQGQAVLESIRKEEWGKELPVIAFTVSNDINLMNQSLKSGITEYLDKANVSVQQVIEIIQLRLSAS
jgi:CheY-like chemotaxis protein